VPLKEQDHLPESVADGEAGPAGSPLIEGAGCVGCVFGRFLPFTRCCLLPPNPYTLAC
jgi:sporulation killing factor